MALTILKIIKNTERLHLAKKGRDNRLKILFWTIKNQSYALFYVKLVYFCAAFYKKGVSIGLKDWPNRKKGHQQPNIISFYGEYRSYQTNYRGCS